MTPNEALDNAKDWTANTIVVIPRTDEIADQVLAVLLEFGLTLVARHSSSGTMKAPRMAWCNIGRGPRCESDRRALGGR